jgi:hypothetical protein
MAEPRKFGEVLDALGVQACLADDDLIVNAVVLCKIVEANGDVGFVMVRDEASTWMDDFLLVKLANREVDQQGLSHRSGEDDVE